MKLAVYFPGVGYHCDKPLLYYARKIAAACGFDQHITLSYTTQIRDLLGNPANMKAAFLELYEQAESELDKTSVFSQQSGVASCCDEILFISKSVGTAIAARYAGEHSLPCRTRKTTSAVPRHSPLPAYPVYAACRDLCFSSPEWNRLYRNCRSLG